MWKADRSQASTAEGRAADNLNKAWISLRAERDRRLASTDWTQINDAPVDASSWAVYRQSLRDLPGMTDDPRNPIWPKEPA